MRRLARKEKGRSDKLSRALKERDEALAFQAATEDILTAISRSTSHAKPVFEAIVRSVPRLFDTRYVAVFLLKGEELQLAAAKADVAFERRHAASFRRFQQSFPQPIHWGGFTGKALRSGKVSQIAPIIGNPKASPQAVKIAKEFGYNTMLIAPLMRDGRAIGGIGTTRPGVKLFSARELALFKAFAAQAVIAIENARRFNETKEALERQTATAEILKVISASPTSTQPVFESIVNNCGILFKDCRVALWQISEGQLVPRASTGYVPGPMPLDRESAIGACVLESRTIHFSDLRSAAEQHPRIKQLGLKHGYLSGVFAPLLRDGQAIGAISLLRRELGAFSDKEVTLLGTFADQAVIAIENARLFNETKEALERQTATADILKVISGSPTDVQPVLDSIAERATLLCNAKAGFVTRFDGELLHLAAFHGVAGASVDTIRAMHPMKPALGGSIAARVVHSRVPVQVPDVLADPTYAHKTAAQATGYRSVLGVPLVREGQIAGVIVVVRAEAGLFPQQQVQVLQTFADQAVIAIENVRLFNETKEALEQQTTTASVLRVIAGSPTDLKPVMTAVVERAARLLEADHALIGQSDGENIHWLAAYGCPVPDGARSITRELPSGRAILDLQTTQIDDIGQIERDSLLERSYGRFGVRTICATPLIREGRAVGVILLRRTQVRPFTEKQMSLLRTFADQAVIAIENARLFNETREALEQQTASSEILRVISSTPGDIQPVLEAIVQNALRLCGASFGGIWAFDGTLFRCMHAIFPPTSPPEFVDGLTTSPIRPGPETPLRRVAIDKAPVHTADLLSDPAFSPPPHYRREGMRAALAVPMLKDGAVIGALAFHRYEPKPFTEKQIALVQAFASQAVIAIENSRLFGELKSSNASLRDALEQQTATAGVLRVISGSPTDTRPVFDVIAKSAMCLFGGLNVAILLRREKEFVLAGYSGPGMEDLPEQVRAAPLDPANNFPSRAILEGKVLNVTDWEGADVPEHERFVAKSLGIKSGLMVPLLRQGEGIGAIAVVRATEGPFIDKDIALLRSFADQAVIAIENVRLFNETKEALERQTAISDILRVISGSPADVKPVLDTVASHAARICHAQTVDIVLAEGLSLRVVASVGDEGRVLGQVLPLDRRSVSGRSIVDRVPVHVANMQEAESEFPLGCELARKYGFRTILGVPLLREGRALGAIMVRRTEVRPIEDKHVALLKTFADQAAIAIENARLFNETKEALERQTATAEILKVISASPSDVQPVFDAVAVNAARVCGVDDVAILRTEERDLRRVAHYGSVPVTPDTLVPVPPGSVNERVLSERRTLHVPDTAAPSFAREFPGSQFPAMGVRALLATPLVHDGAAVGVIHLRRSEPRPFTDKQIALLETFADQAVIAIENVRLFNETREALERQTATGEILASMSGSMTDTKPVFDAIVRNLLRLFGTGYAVVSLRRGQEFDLAGFQGEPGFERLQDAYPMPVDGDTIVGEVLIERRVAKYAPIAGNPAVPRRTAELAQQFGFNSVMAAPMMWKGEAIGTILTARQQALPFDDKQVTLIQSFADQAVIAIENVRLFTELESRNRDLRVALEQQTATSELLKVIGRSTFELRPVFETLAENAARLCEADRALIFRFEEQRLRIVATHNTPPEFRAFVEQNPIPLGRGSSVGRAASERRTVHIPDVWADPEHNYKGRQVDPHRTVLAVPMLRVTELLGVIFIYRHEVRPFADSQIALVETFADQAVIAIENARLFKELQERTEALTKSVDQLTALGEVGQAISSTLDLEIVLKTIVSRAVQLAGLDAGSIYEFEARNQRFHLRATQNVAEDILDVYRKSPIRLGEGAVGRAGATREPVMVEDLLDVSYRSRARDALIKSGARALLAVPLLGEEHVLGALVVSRKSPGPFSREVIDLLNTFATQSAVAIQNARLFREIAEKSVQLEEASRHKSQFLASMSHELRTPLNAILGFNEMILGQVYGEVPSDMKEPLEDIQKSGKHLLRLINNVLDLAKIEAGKMELSLADYSVHDTVESVRSTLRPLAEAKGLELVVSVPENIPLAYGDGGRLTQCLMNLAGNSLKFTKEGKVEIAVQAENGCLRWRVSDTGIGIPADKIPTLFSEFKQTDATIASEYGGTGLGLSITKKFVEMHGGRIWVESELGKGSVFTLEIPLRVTVPA